MDLCVIADKFTFCDVINLGNFNGDYGFCDRLLAAIELDVDGTKTIGEIKASLLKDIGGLMVLT